MVPSSTDASFATPCVEEITSRISRPNFLRKFIIAFVVRRNGHDRAGAVAHQDVVRNPDRNLFVVHRIDGICASEYTRLFGLRRSIDVAFALYLLDVCLHRGTLDPAT